MDEDEIIDRVKKAMFRYVEGSESGPGGVCFTIHDTFEECRTVAWFPEDRDARDQHLKLKNARATLEEHKAALAEAGLKIIAREPNDPMVDAGAQCFPHWNRAAAQTVWLVMWDAAPAAGGAEDR